MDADFCLYAENEVRSAKITMPNNVFRVVMEEGVVPADQPSSWELFDNPLRLYTGEQNAQTIRFIRAQPAAAVEWTGSGRWANIKFSVLQLSRYHVYTTEASSDGIFVLILGGSSRGQIHAWSSQGISWYDGFEAEVSGTGTMRNGIGLLALRTTRRNHETNASLRTSRFVVTSTYNYRNFLGKGNPE
jgi:hypothetical protein